MATLLKTISHTGLLLSSFIGLCFGNYKVSGWIFKTCGTNIWDFVPVLLLFLTVTSLTVYLFVVCLLRLYYTRVLRSIQSLNLVEFSFMMSKLQQMEYRRALASDISNINTDNLCLVCYEFQPRTFTLPCQHQVMCGSCAWRYIATCLRDHASFRCILCRTEVTEFKGDITVMLNKLNIGQLSSLVSNTNKTTSYKTSNVVSLSTTFFNLPLSEGQNCQQ
eukprot:TCONS_00028903-protein